MNSKRWQHTPFAVFLVCMAPTAVICQDPDAASVEAKRRSYLLKFSGREHVVIPKLRYEGDHPITVEAIVLAPSHGSVVANFDTAGTGIDVVNGYWNFHINDGRRGNNGYATIRSDSKATTDEPVHVAGVFDGKTITMYVNGRRQRHTMKTGKLVPSKQPFMIGADPDDRAKPQAHFGGFIDEVRISNVVRYRGDFAAPVTLKPDMRTLVLYRLDEGEGDIANDASPSELNAKIFGAKWVKQFKD